MCHRQTSFTPFTEKQWEWMMTHRLVIAKPKLPRRQRAECDWLVPGPTSILAAPKLRVIYQLTERAL